MLSLRASKILYSSQRWLWLSTIHPPATTAKINTNATRSISSLLSLTPWSNESKFLKHNRNRNMNRNVNVNGNGSRWMQSSNLSTSESKPGVFERLRDTFSNTTSRKKEEQVTEQLRKMADYQVWDLNQYAKDLESTMSNWKTKIPGMGYTKEVKTIRKAQKIQKAVITYVGGDATTETLENLTRKDKLKIAVEGDIDVDDIDIFIGQFNNMNMMHKVLRYRKEHGMSIPKTDAEMQMAVQHNAMKVMTKKEKAKMQKSMQNRTKQMLRR